MNNINFGKKIRFHVIFVRTVLTPPVDSEFNMNFDANQAEAL